VWRWPDGGDAEDDRAEHGEDERQRRHQDDHDAAEELQVVLALVGHGRRRFRPQDGDDQDVEDIQADEDEARYQRAEEHVAGARRDDVEFRRH
jgi:hypothetical protein